MSKASREVITIFYLFGTRLGVDFIVSNLFLADRRVQWSSGYDFCLTWNQERLRTEGLQFDPGLNQFCHSLFFKVIPKPYSIPIQIRYIIISTTKSPGYVLCV